MKAGTVAMLEIKGLKTHFKTDDGWLHAVDGVDMTIDAGETLCVVGESGCGKSVTAKTVMKLIDMPPGKIAAGQVLWQGRDLVPLGPDEMSKIRAKDSSEGKRKRPSGPMRLERLNALGSRPARFASPDSVKLWSRATLSIADQISA